MRRPPPPRALARPATMAAVDLPGIPVGAYGLAVTRGVGPRSDCAASHDEGDRIRIRIRIAASDNPGDNPRPPRAAALLRSACDGRNPVVILRDGPTTPRRKSRGVRPSPVAYGPFVVPPGDPEAGPRLVRDDNDNDDEPAFSG